jgi:hypothetical protein
VFLCYVNQEESTTKEKEWVVLSGGYEGKRSIFFSDDQQQEPTWQVIFNNFNNLSEHDRRAVLDGAI